MNLEVEREYDKFPFCIDVSLNCITQPDSFYNGRIISEGTNLSEQSLRSSTRRGRVVDVYVVIFCWQGFLHERFVEDHAVDFHVVLSFHEIAFWNAQHTLQIWWHFLYWSIGYQLT